jgi:hypothetical protein
MEDVFQYGCLVSVNEGIIAKRQKKHILDKETDVEDCSHHFHNTINSLDCYQTTRSYHVPAKVATYCSQKAWGSFLDSNELEYARCIVVLGCRQPL